MYEHVQIFNRALVKYSIVSDYDLLIGGLYNGVQSGYREIWYNLTKLRENGL